MARRDRKLTPEQQDFLKRARAELEWMYDPNRRAEADHRLATLVHSQGVHDVVCGCGAETCEFRGPDRPARPSRWGALHRWFR